MRDRLSATAFRSPRRRSPAPFWLALSAFAVAAASASLPAQPRRGSDLPPIDREALAHWSCRAGQREEWQVHRAPIADGSPLAYRQEPAVLTAAHLGPVALSEVIVVGDVPELHFRRYDPYGDDPVERWERIRTTTVGGRLASVFAASWPEDVFASTLAVSAVGPDYPIVFWGTLLRPGADEGEPVYLRVASTALPTSQVSRIDDTVQFASHVVNLVLPDFAAPRIAGGSFEVDELGAAKRFFDHFQDAYEVLSFASEPAVFLDYDAWHRNVRNRITGTGAGVFDDSAAYGSAGTLHGVETFRDARALTPRLVNHELSHQWGHYFDWGRLAGLQREWPDTVHAPVMFPGHSLIGAKLWPLWRVVRTEAGEFRLGRTLGPIEQGPLELYAMGLLAGEDLPELTVFTDQEQFSDGRTTIQDGAPVHGATRVVSFRDLLGLYGRRNGPVPRTLRRALVVVSRDTLLSQREMDYWNFHAARVEDPKGASPMSYEGYVSMDRVTRYGVDLTTRITPKTLPAIGQEFDVDFPPFSRDDCRAVQFAAPMATRYRVGERIRLSGTVNARDRRDFSTVLVRFWPYGGAPSKVVREYTEVSRGGDFQLEVEFREGQDGQFLFEVFLFWPDAPPQFARCTLSPVTVAGGPASDAPPPRPAARGPTDPRSAFENPTIW